MYTATLIIEKRKRSDALVLFSEEETKKKDTMNVVNTMINNNTVNKTTDNSINTSVVINVQGGFNELSNTLAPILKGSLLSAKEIKCVEQVLLMLRNEGITTPEALKTLIDEKSVTIQQLAEDVKNSGDRECDAAVEFGAEEVAKVQKKAKQTKQEKNRLIDLHIRHSVVHLFQSLVLKKESEKDLQITSDSLATNPLYLSQEGLSVWSQNSGIKQGNTSATKFGIPDKNQVCSWLLVQEDRLWRTLIMDILISRLEEFLIDEYTGKMKEVKKQPDVEDPAKCLMIRSMMDSEDEEEYCIGGYKYEGKYSDLMNRIRGFKNEGHGKDAFVTATISDMKKHLSETCKQASNKGWYHLTKKVSQQQAELKLISGVGQLRIAE